MVVIQKGNTRYSFKQDNSGCRRNCCIETEILCESGLGATVNFRWVDKETGNAFYIDMMKKGFKRFRTVAEVSWYATVENNKHTVEEWRVDGIYLIPVISDVLA